MAGAVKAGAFAAFVRVFVLTFSNYVNDWRPIIWTLAVVSMVFGAVMAIVQTNVKRTLAYSSINHAGFILLAVGAASETGHVGRALLRVRLRLHGGRGLRRGGDRVAQGRRAHHPRRLPGLSRSNPMLAGVMTVFLLAQAGIPFTSGFFAKFYAIDAVVGRHADWIAVVAMLTGAVAAFLYLRIVVAMYLGPSRRGAGHAAPARPVRHQAGPRHLLRGHPRGRARPRDGGQPDRARPALPRRGARADPASARVGDRFRQLSRSSSEDFLSPLRLH